MAPRFRTKQLTKVSRLSRETWVEPPVKDVQTLRVHVPRDPRLHIEVFFYSKYTSMKKIGAFIFCLLLVGAGCSKAVVKAPEPDVKPASKNSDAAQQPAKTEEAVPEAKPAATTEIKTSFPALKDIEWVTYGDSNFSIKYPKGFAIRKGDDLSSQPIYENGLAAFAFNDPYFAANENLEGAIAVVAKANCEDMSTYGESAEEMTRYTGEALPLPLPKKFTANGREFTLGYSEDFWTGHGVEQLEYVHKKGTVCYAARLALLVNNPTLAQEEAEDGVAIGPLQEFNPDRFAAVFTEMLKTLVIKK